MEWEGGWNWGKVREGRGGGDVFKKANAGDQPNGATYDVVHSHSGPPYQKQPVPGRSFYRRLYGSCVFLAR